MKSPLHEVKGFFVCDNHSVGSFLESLESKRMCQNIFFLPEPQPFFTRTSSRETDVTDVTRFVFNNNFRADTGNMRSKSSFCKVGVDDEETTRMPKGSGSTLGRIQCEVEGAHRTRGWGKKHFAEFRTRFV